MPADENSADSGADQTPHENSEPSQVEGAEGTAADSAESDLEGRDVMRNEPEETGSDATGEPTGSDAADEPTKPEAPTGEASAEHEPAADADDATEGDDRPETVVIDVDAPVTTGGTGREETAEADSDSDEPSEERPNEDAPEDGEKAGDDEAVNAAAPVPDADDTDTSEPEAGEAAGTRDGDSPEPDASEGGDDAVDATAAAPVTPEPGAKGGDGPEDASENGVAAVAAVKGNKRRRSRLRRAVMWTSASLALVLVVGVGTAYAYYHSLRSDMVQHDIEALLGDEERPDKISDAVNILFIGSDGYEEDSPAYSTEFEGERSDSLMLAHISPDKRVSVVSFPRDSLVQLPECDAYGQTEGTYGYFGMINAAMYHGGPPCVVRTIETLTDIRVDHFVHLSFASFRDVVNAIGGVDMCIPEPMEDRRSKLSLDAGDQTLDGDQALSFVRARYDIGDGGDMGRIDRQQMFLAALADQVTSSDVLSSPSKLNGILQAVAQHSATDGELSLDRMLSIAVTMADVDLSDIEFHTVPWYQAPYDPNRVMWHEEEAAELFSAVREDRPLPALLADDAPVPQESPMDEPTPVDPSPEGNAEETEAGASTEPSARPGEGRDATSNPCQDGLGFGTGEDDW